MGIAWFYLDNNSLSRSAAPQVVTLPSAQEAPQLSTAPAGASLTVEQHSLTVVPASRIEPSQPNDVNGMRPVRVLPRVQSAAAPASVPSQTPVAGSPPPTPPQGRAAVGGVQGVLIQPPIAVRHPVGRAPVVVNIQRSGEEVPFPVGTPLKPQSETLRSPNQGRANLAVGTVVRLGPGTGWAPSAPLAQTRVYRVRPTVHLGANQLTKPRTRR